MVAGAVQVLHLGNGNKTVVELGGGVDLYRKAALVFRAPLGGDHDHAKLAPVAVQGGSRGAFEHGIGLDIIGVDVPGIGVDGHAVDHKKRLAAP